MSTGLFIGRFQPFHKGHLWAVRHILKENRKVLIAIGSSKNRGTAENPLSFGERKRMIELCLHEEGISRFGIAAVPDHPNDSMWVKKAMGLDFDIIYTGNELTRRLFSEAGCKVKSLTRHEDISSSVIRKRIADGKNWKQYVPPTVAGFLDACGFAARLREKRLQ